MPLYEIYTVIFCKSPIIARLKLDGNSQTAIYQQAYKPRLRDKRKFNRGIGACLTLRLSLICPFSRGYAYPGASASSHLFQICSILGNGGLFGTLLEVLSDLAAPQLVHHF